MVVTEFSGYNRKRDISKVPQYGFVDLKKVYSEGVVPGDLQAPEVEYNEIDNPSKIAGKPSDIFEAYRMHDALKAKTAQQSTVTPKEENKA